MEKAFYIQGMEIRECLYDKEKVDYLDTYKVMKVPNSDKLVKVCRNMSECEMELRKRINSNWLI